MSTLTPVKLRTEYKTSPLGLGEPAPRLSWVLDGEGRNLSQQAYHILVASSAAKLTENNGDLWDSGKVLSDQSTQVEYAGAALPSRCDCWWKVTVWNQNGEQGPFSEPAYWSMGLLNPSDWQAQWIANDIEQPDDARKVPLQDCAWFGFSDSDRITPGEDCFIALRGTVTLPDTPVASAYLQLSAAGPHTVYVNGKPAVESDDRFGCYLRPVLCDVTELLQSGNNTLGVRANYRGNQAPPSAIGKLSVTLDNGDTMDFRVDESWQCLSDPSENWLTDLEAAWEPCVRMQYGDGGNWQELRPIDDIPACPQMRREFTTAKPIVRGTAYATALGLYELRINGQKVGDDVLTPGWTDYTQRVYYQTYDVTNLLQEGANALAAYVGHGWYSGYLGWVGERGLYGKNPRFLAQVEIEYEDGTREVIATDPTWKSTFGPMVAADLYMGETYDVGREMPGWDCPGFDDSGWDAVQVIADIETAVETSPDEPCAVTEEITAKSMTEPQPGVYVYDLEQNMVGWARVRVDTPSPATIQLRFAEILKPDGTLYVENLRSARSIDEFTTGSGEFVYEPRFTFHGFRYVEITGCDTAPALTDVVGRVVHTRMDMTGSFECDLPMLNQLQSNIQWGQRGNFLEIPTDCPQRDERLGWTGDAQVFARTACFNMDSAAFFTKYIQDLKDGQSDEGNFQDAAPGIPKGRSGLPPIGAPAWADAGVIIPWVVYQQYGDTRLLARCYDSMKAWVEFIRAANPDGVREELLGNNYGDWLSIDADTPKDLIATAFYAHVVDLLAQAAAIVGQVEDATEYERLHDMIKEEFVKTFVDADGRLQGNTQTAYVLALHFKLLPESLVSRAINHLVDRIEDRDWHLNTGFLGCPYLLHALSNHGRTDVAYRLLRNDTFPSWGYSVKHGATTIWERWDGWTDHKGFQDPGMNSFNHYAYGAVGEWMYRVMAGLDLEPEAPGYKGIVIHPRIGGGFSKVHAQLDSIHGTIESGWTIENDVLAVNVAVPINTQAVVHLPGTADDITESGAPLASADGVLLVNNASDHTAITVGSGTYQFKKCLK